MVTFGKSVILPFFALLIGCSDTGSRLSSDNEKAQKVLDHIVTPIQARLAECKFEKTDERYPLALNYVREVAHFLMEKNSDIFQGFFDPSEICITISSGGGSHGASARSENGFFEVSPSFLYEKIASDIDLVAVIAHELAHIVNNRDFHPLNQPRQLMANPEFRSAHTKFLSLIQDFDETTFAHLKSLERELKDDGNEDLSKLAHRTLLRVAYDIGRFRVRETTEEIGELLKERMDTRDVLSEEELTEKVKEKYDAEGKHHPKSVVLLAKIIADKRDKLSEGSAKLESLKTALIDEVTLLTTGETEADIGGFGMFVRAGLMPSGFYQSRLKWEYDDGDEFGSPEECLKAIGEGKVPIMKNHYDEGYTSPCYQLYTLTVVEPRFYQENAPELLNAAGTSIPTATKLEDVKREYLKAEGESALHLKTLR